MAQREVIAALVLIGIAVWYGGMTAELPARPMPNTPGPAFFPWLIAASLLVLSLALLGQGLLRLRTQAARVFAGVPWRPAATLLLFGAYVAALPHAGFLAATIPFFGGLMLVYGERRWLFVVLPSAAIPVLLFYLFRDGFQILLPRGGC